MTKRILECWLLLLLGEVAALLENLSFASTDFFSLAGSLAEALGGLFLAAACFLSGAMVGRSDQVCADLFRGVMMSCLVAAIVSSKEVFSPKMNPLRHL